MRRFRSHLPAASAALCLLALSVRTAAAQAPLTRVEREAREDIYTDDRPSTASARGSAVAQRRYASTPSMQEARRESREIAGPAPRSAFRYEVLDNGEDLVEPEPYAFDDDRRVTRARLRGFGGSDEGDLRYTYGEQGELVRLDRYATATAPEPYRSYGYRYTMEGTVIEEEIMPDGSRRFAREVGLDEFQATQGPGNQPRLDNRPTNQYYDVPNAAESTPTHPRLDDARPSIPD